MSKSAPSALLVKDVSVNYGWFEAITGISLDVKNGEFVGLIGLNGAGKTTLIKAILALRKADHGEIRLFGLESENLRAKQRLAFLPERFEPSWFMSGLEFLRFSTALYKNHPEYRKVTDNEFFDMADKLALDPAALNNRVHTYSKGMRQKLGLLSTILTAAEFLILDEPMSGLDPKARACVKDALLGMRAKGKTVFICSHILEDMDEICDRVAVLDNRRIVFFDTPQKLKSVTGCKKLERAFLQFIEKKAAA